MTVFRGLIPPVCTPLTPEGDVDARSLADLVDFEVAAGAAGVFVLGSSGEAIYLDDGQRRQVAVAARAAVRGRVPLLVGVLAPSTRRVIQQAVLLGDVAPDGVVATAPFYAQTSPTEIETHFRRVAQAVPGPVLAYDIPGNVGYKLPADVTVALLTGRVVTGIKDSSGDNDTFASLVRQVPADVNAAFLSGSDTTALAALDSGAGGLVPGLANARPDLFSALLAAHERGDAPRAEALQRAISTLNGIFHVGRRYGLGRHASEVGALKHVLASRGVIRSGVLPEPLQPYPPEARDDVDQIIADVDRQLAADRNRPQGGTHE